MFRRLFNQHPRSVNETYWQHLRHASSFSGAMLKGGFLCGVHALLPFVFERSGSETIKTLHDRMVVNRTAQAKSEKSAS